MGLTAQHKLTFEMEVQLSLKPSSATIHFGIRLGFPSPYLELPESEDTTG
jgi:hypothetical protein